MISNAQRWFTLAIAAALCIYAASASSATDPAPNEAKTGASDVASQEEPGAAPDGANDAQDLLPARTLATRVRAMRSCQH